jgi:hypothetical protein
MHAACVVLASVIALTASGSGVAADPQTDSKAGNRSEKKVVEAKPADRIAAARISAEEEKAALAFARKHHKELYDLLQQLKSAGSAEYRRALRELHTASQRINRWEGKQPTRFKQELEAWKLDSEVRLLIARWSMSQDPELETEIRRRLRLRYQNRIDRLEQEQARLRERLASIETQLKTGREQLDESVKSDWERLSGRARAVQQANRAVRASRRKESEKKVVEKVAEKISEKSDKTSASKKDDGSKKVRSKKTDSAALDNAQKPSQKQPKSDKP